MKRNYWSKKRCIDYIKQSTSITDWNERRATIKVKANPGYLPFILAGIDGTGLLKETLKKNK